MKYFSKHKKRFVLKENKNNKHENRENLKIPFDKVMEGDGDGDGDGRHGRGGKWLNNFQHVSLQFRQPGIQAGKS